MDPLILIPFLGLHKNIKRANLCNNLESNFRMKYNNTESKINLQIDILCNNEKASTKLTGCVHVCLENSQILLDRTITSF